ncbi:MAG: hypothetical protein MUO52_07005, partial [Desulfobacterales bacterium]|nr:hypothetical protein [Desulfobacterales bacterium]
NTKANQRRERHEPISHRGGATVLKQLVIDCSMSNGDGLEKSRHPVEKRGPGFCNSMKVLDSGWSLFPPRGAGAGMTKKGLFGLFT